MDKRYLVSLSFWSGFLNVLFILYKQLTVTITVWNSISWSGVLQIWLQEGFSCHYAYLEYSLHCPKKSPITRDRGRGKNDQQPQIAAIKKIWLKIRNVFRYVMKLQNLFYRMWKIIFSTQWGFDNHAESFQPINLINSLLVWWNINKIYLCKIIESLLLWWF